MGIFATGQTYEQLILHLLAHPLPEARDYGAVILDAVQGGDAELRLARRAARPRRRVGRVPARARARRRARWVARLGLDREPERRRTAGRRCGCCTSTATRTRCSPRCCSRPPASARRRRAIRVAALGADERAALLADLVGERANRRHRPGRGFEALRYRFEIVSDYGAFRDLQRHRMLTVQWQRADAAPRRRRARRRSTPRAAATTTGARSRSRAAEWERLAGAGHERAALYALCLGYRIRYVLDLNAREAMQLIELRSGREGHPSYRAVAHEMHRLIASVHPAVAAAMTPRRHEPSRAWSASSARCARRRSSTR